VQRIKSENSRISNVKSGWTCWNRRFRSPVAVLHYTWTLIVRPHTLCLLLKQRSPFCILLKMLSKICRLVLHVGALVQATVPRSAKTYWKRDQTFKIDQKRSKKRSKLCFFSVNYNGWLLWCLWIIWMLISAFCVYSEFGVFLVYLHANFYWSLNCLNCITSYP